MKTFFNLPVTVSEHNTLNSSKGIIRNRDLKGETEQNILEYLKPQGVTAVKRFKIKKGEQLIGTNTFLLTFNMITLPKSVRIFYRITPVEIYVPNPLTKDASTVKNTITMKIIALKILALCAIIVAWEVITILLYVAKTPQNV